MEEINWYLYEEEAAAEGFSRVCGIDEAGRGPLAGPVFAACVVLRPGEEIAGLNDSKKLSEKKRELLFDEITAHAADYSIAMASEQEIDEINILQATFLAMRRAFNDLHTKPDLALIDGNRAPGLEVAERTIVRGDAKSASIAAASILAKVSRDRYLYDLDSRYPQYQFAKHKGYGTKLHYEMLAQYGISPVHRRSFLKNLERHGK